MAQIVNITSEALQATIRRLLPSQRGFGEDLQASNVIQPIIDLTPTAEGSSVAQNLQTAIAFGSQTAFNVRNATTTIANTAGFYRIICGIAVYTESSAAQSAILQISDGSSTKDVWALNYASFLTNNTAAEKLDLTVFLRSGDSLSWVVSNLMQVQGSVRQIADVNGVLVNPSGFTPQ
jgi:hypothetical protein